MSPHPRQYRSMSLIKKMRTSTARSAAFAGAAKRLKLRTVRIKSLSSRLTRARRGGSPSREHARGCHHNSLENSNICVFGNIQTLTRVFLPETDMRLSQRNLGAPRVAHE